MAVIASGQTGEQPCDLRLVRGLLRKVGLVLDLADPLMNDRAEVCLRQQHAKPEEHRLQRAEVTLEGPSNVLVLYGCVYN